MNGSFEVTQEKPLKALPPGLQLESTQMRPQSELLSPRAAGSRENHFGAYYVHMNLSWGHVSVMGYQRLSPPQWLLTHLLYDLLPGPSFFLITLPSSGGLKTPHEGSIQIKLYRCLSAFCIVAPEFLPYR